ncbi:MFS transporter [Sporormia fimetaria CBS 119925]|uniref:MFS transporter n=1 Tax=Sporormia fimetaria CBS 119925 TaxID=1340428 RepID=A0A6A6VDB7_9PLEO|nr:MFS transporter [Sporormia fimetaria CBS 119925]
MSDVAISAREIDEVDREKAESVHESEDNEAQYLHGWPFVWLALALLAGSFMLALDNTILATAIPQITSDFNSLNDIGWYGSSYLITQMSLLPTCGRVYTFYNVKWTYIALLLVFELGSAVCAVAQNSVTLIVGRAVAGVGAAGLLGGAAVIVSYCIALRKRAMFMGMISIVYGIGSVTGPLIGGVITDNKRLTWRFCFWINLPVGAIGLALIWWTLKRPPPAVKAGLSKREKLRQLDLPGATILIGAIVCLLLALQWGGIVYRWSHPKVLGCLIGFILLLGIFLFLQIRDQEVCTIPLGIFRNRTVSISTTFMLFIQASMVTITYYWPLYFQSVKGTSARDSGIYLLPLCISSSIATLLCGWLISKIGYYVPFLWVGAPILAIGCGLYQLVSVHAPAGEWIGYQIVSGAGYGLCISVPILAVQVVLDQADVPTGCVMVLFFQCLGGALATSIAQNLFTDKLLRVLEDVDGVDGAAVVRAGAKDFRQVIRPDRLELVIEAFGSALRDVFWLALACAVAALATSAWMEWRKMPKQKKQEVPSVDS